MFEVTSLVITFNQERWATGLMDSLLAQGEENMELLISDDASTDATPDIINEYLPDLRDKFRQVRFTHHKENLGGRGRENIKWVSAQASESRFTQILEGDDEWLKHKTQSCMQFLDSNPDFGVVHGNFILDFDGTHHPSGWQALGVQEIPSGWVFGHFLINNRLMICSSMFRSEIYKSCFDYDLFTDQQIILGDYAGTLRMARLAQFQYINKDLAVYRWHAEGTVNNPATRQQIIDNTAHVQALARLGII